MEREKIMVTFSPDGKVAWKRGGEGIRVREFVETYPCKALKYLAGGGRGDELGEAVVSVIGGLYKLQEFNRQNLCGEDENLLQQI